MLSKASLLRGESLRAATISKIMTCDQKPSPFSLRICQSCRAPNCCEIEPPFLTRHDIETIEQGTGIPQKAFALPGQNSSGQTFYQMRAAQNGKCIFYCEETKKCRIYEHRPLDCRLYPLDIDIQDGRFVWIAYKTCPIKDDITPQETSALVEAAERRILPYLKPEIDIYAKMSTDLFRRGQWIAAGDIGVRS